MVIPVEIGTNVSKAKMWGDKPGKVFIINVFPFMAQSLFYWEG